jgi:hypothetical protein
MKQTENAVEKEILKFMKQQGYRQHRNQVGLFKGPGGSRIAVGKPGYPDWSFLKSVHYGLVKICHVEVKGTGKEPKDHQIAYIDKLNALGEPAWWADSLAMHEENFSKFMAVTSAA